MKEPRQRQCRQNLKLNTMLVLKAGDMERCYPTCLAFGRAKGGAKLPKFYAAKLASKFVKVVFLVQEVMLLRIPLEIYRGSKQEFKEYVDECLFYWKSWIPNTHIKNFEPIWSEVKDVWTSLSLKTFFKPQTSLNTQKTL